MSEAKSYAGFGIPEPAPCPSWCAGNHVGDDVGPGRAAIFQGASEIGGAVLAGGTAVSVGMNWIEYFADGARQPPCGTGKSSSSFRPGCSTSRSRPRSGTWPGWLRSPALSHRRSKTWSGSSAG